MPALRTLAILGGLLALGLCAPPAEAQPRAHTISIGRISSTKTCTFYQESAGKSSAVITAYGAAQSESWRTWLVKDCVDNFATMKTSLEAALAATGKFALKPSGGTYLLAGAVSQVGIDGNPAPRAPAAQGGYGEATGGLFVSMDITLRDASGRTVYGGLLTKHMETGSAFNSSGFDSRSARSGEGLYTELQHQVALAVARLVAFRIEPLRVTGAQGRQIRLNYGTPLLTLGAIVHANSPDGGPPVRYRVTSANTDSAFAELDGEGNPARIVTGATATVIESDDPTANERRVQRVDLP
jgi:hypothetical protein